MTQHVRNENDLRCSNTGGRSEVQLDAGSSPTILPQQDAVVTDLYKTEEDAGRAALAGWIRHKQVRPIIEAARDATETFVAPVRHHLTGQRSVTLLAGSALLIRGALPNGQHDEFVLDPATGWPMTPGVRHMLLTDFPAWLTIVAYRLASADVPLDPDYPGDHLVIAQLLLLDCWAPGYDLVKDLNVAGPTVYNRQGRGTPFIRRRRTDRATLNASRVLEDLSRRERGDRTVAAAPYAATKPRAAGRQALEKSVRIKVLRDVVALYPEVTAVELLDRWCTSRKHLPGYLYRSLIAQALSLPRESKRVLDLKPSLRTLQRDFDALADPGDGPRQLT